MKVAVNLAAQPFRNERLPVALVLLSAVLLTAVSVIHVAEVRRLAGREATLLDAEVQRLSAEVAAREQEIAEAEKTPVSPAASRRWEELTQIVRRRSFAWTGLLGAFERALPPDVRILTLAPTVQEGEFVLNVTAVARNIEGVTGPDGLLASFRRSQEFASALPQSVVDDRGEVQVTLVVRSRGGRP
jgi:hypothetical protein